eukprot:Partr_v1_DN25039_c1_g1_i3_m50853 putative Dehydrodolichyl diphosphate synthase
MCKSLIPIWKSRAILNVCCPYTSRHEIRNALNICSQELSMDEEASDIREIFEKNLMTASCPPLDLLIRTSGETRLSDFMLWQCMDNCQVQFVEVLWPEFGFAHLIGVLLEF